MTRTRNKKLKPIKAWALVNEGDYVLYSWDGVPAIFATKSQASKYKMKVVKVLITAL